VRVAGRGVALLAAALCACARGGAGRADLALADRYERGDGVPRDFRKAAALLARSCAEGRGVAAACRRLAFARAQGRGTPVEPFVLPLLTTACQRGDWLACGGMIPFDEPHAQAACDRGDHAACLAITTLWAWSQSGTLDAQRRDYEEAACRAGLLEGCLAIAASGLDGGAPGDEVARERLGAACRGGDADACAAIETPIPPRELCDAGDFAACIVVDDEAALTIACDNQLAEACERLGLRGLEQEPPDPRVAERLERACRLGASTACEYAQRPRDLANGCVGFLTYVIAPDHRRALSRLRGVDAAHQPWTAPAARILVLVDHDAVPPAAYDEVARHVDVPVFVATAPDDEAPRGALTRAVRVVIDAALADEPVVTGRHDVSGHRIAHTNAIVDGDGVVRAVFWGLPKMPVSFARCVRHVLQEL